MLGRHPKFIDDICAWLEVVKSEYSSRSCNNSNNHGLQAVCGFLLTVARQWMTIIYVRVNNIVIITSF